MTGFEVFLIDRFWGIIWLVLWWTFDVKFNVAVFCHSSPLLSNFLMLPFWCPRFFFFVFFMFSYSISPSFPKKYSFAKHQLFSKHQMFHVICCNCNSDNEKSKLNYNEDCLYYLSASSPNTLKQRFQTNGTHMVRKQHKLSVRPLRCKADILMMII